MGRALSSRPAWWLAGWELLVSTGHREQLCGGGWRLGATVGGWYRVLPTHSHRLTASPHTHPTPAPCHHTGESKRMVLQAHLTETFPFAIELARNGPTVIGAFLTARSHNVFTLLQSCNANAIFLLPKD